MKIQSLAVFCGSKSGTDPLFAQHATELGELLSAENITLIYGGGGNGIMGSLADAMIQHKGNVIGVIPKILLAWEQEHREITQLLIVDSMHVRKQKIYDLSDAAMVLPGGFGTLDELFEMLTWNQLSIHNKPIFILNSNGFYDHLLQHMHLLEKNGFLYEPVQKRITILNHPRELLEFL
ncbi:MAG: TIGR00730 family Rossman fold protein [Chitinophagaceae bacterium]|nr:MAG: TIGR00730 family Rossman fold protein [Chitinophagaceae bacterium]